MEPARPTRSAILDMSVFTATMLRYIQLSSLFDGEFMRFRSGNLVSARLFNGNAHVTKGI